MKFVIAPDKFKGSLSSFQFCDAAEQGIRQIFPKAEVINLPLSDGGDGTINVVAHYLGGERITVNVSDPLFRNTSATYIWSAKLKTAYIEMAEASGLHLLKPEELNCMETTSLGTGELILDALKKGAEQIYLGIGGSATNDGGMGMAHALGYRFLNEVTDEISPIGKNLQLVKHIQTDNVSPLMANCTFKIACDVDNPFYGTNGAAFIYGPQKGASPKDIVFLDQGLIRFAHLLENTFGTNVQNLPGAGAAGGIGGGAHVFLNAELVSGVDLMKEMAQFEKKIKGADWVITGEGKLDAQTLAGKTINGILTDAKKHQIPVAAFCGSVSLTQKQQEQLGLAYVTSILTEVVDLPTAMEHGHDNLVKAVYNFASILKNYIS